MNIEEKDLPEIKSFLERNWHEGHRWVCYENDQNITTNDMIGVRNLSLANTYCENRNTDEHLYSFKSINSVLRTINEWMGQLGHHPTDISRVEHEIKHFPIEPVRNGENVANSLATGELYPVLCHKTIDPLREINQYHIIEHKFPRHQVYEIGHELYRTGSYNNYQEANDKFQRQLKINAAETERDRPNLLLIGEFKNKKLDLNIEGWPENNTGIMLLTAYNLYDTDRKEKLYSQMQINDPAVPVLIKQPVLAQFNSHTQKINFFDEQLHSIRPDREVLSMNVEHFGFGKPVTIHPGPMQVLYQVQQQQEDKRQGLHNKV